MQIIYENDKKLAFERRATAKKNAIEIHHIYRFHAYCCSQSRENESRTRRPLGMYIPFMSRSPWQLMSSC